jgi:hypothetical protein
VVVSKASLYAAAAAGGGAEGGAEGGAGARGQLVVEGALSEQHEELVLRVRAVIYSLLGA